MGAQAELVAVAGGAVMVVAAVQIAAHFTGVIDFEVVAFFRKFAASTVPVAEHPRRIAIEGRSRVSASGKAQSGESAYQVQGVSAGNRF
ncbi:hypothetical protein D3C71_1368890 [compost metagenome]